MNYSANPARVRVDFFKESGKWYATEAMEWRYYDGSKYLIHDAFLHCLISQFNGHYQGMTAVCLEPYHEHSHPVMIHKWNEQQPAPLKVV